jgi:hypothetical protein
MSPVVLLFETRTQQENKVVSVSNKSTLVVVVRILTKFLVSRSFWKVAVPDHTISRIASCKFRRRTPSFHFDRRERRFVIDLAERYIFPSRSLNVSCSIFQVLSYAHT